MHQSMPMCGLPATQPCFCICCRRTAADIVVPCSACLCRGLVVGYRRHWQLAFKHTIPVPLHSAAQQEAPAVHLRTQHAKRKLVNAFVLRCCNILLQSSQCAKTAVCDSCVGLGRLLILLGACSFCGSCAHPHKLLHPVYLLGDVPECRPLHLPR